MNKSVLIRNRFAYGLGTVGRDMTYALVSMYLIYYLTEVLRLDDSSMLWITGILVVARIFDALNDPIMGTIVDNTATRWGKYKPWIAFGAFTSGILTVLLFTDFGLHGAGYIVAFALLYLLWGIAYTANDISYWSMMPSLSNDQKEREKIGALARISANIGLFAVVVAIVPVTAALADFLGSQKQAYFVFALAVCLVLWLGQLVTLFGVREPPSVYAKEAPTSLRGMVKAIFGNDQLLYTAIAMALFMIGYVTTTSFGLYFFKYAYRDEAMYSVFALVLGVSQILALVVFPFLSIRFSRRQLYTAATGLVLVGYAVFFFAPMNMIPIGIAGICLFVGQAFIQLLMLVFLADTIEYGHWKLHKRNESISFSLQPFINKMGGAIGTGIVGLTLVVSGINSAASPDDVSSGGLLLMKLAMMVLPLVFIVAGYLVYLKRYRIDKAFYERILAELSERNRQAD